MYTPPPAPVANEFSISPTEPCPILIVWTARVARLSVPTTPSVLVTNHSRPFESGSAEVISSDELSTPLRS